MTSISVILPVYNVGPYIGDCIESLKRQTLQDLEFIFVDDCSADNSIALAEDFARTDPRVRILRNPKNMGAGPSRNRGIEAAKGDYLSFVDPDDRIAPDFLELLYEAAVSSGADIAKGICVYMDEDGKTVDRPFRLIDRIRRGLDKGKPLYMVFTYEHWSAIYHKSLFENPDVRYGVTRHDQDTLFLLRACSQTEKICLCDEAKYFFTRRKGSAMHRIAADGWDDMAMFFESLVDHLLEYPSDEVHQCDYVLKKLNVHLARYYALKNDPRLKKDSPAYLERLRRSVLRLPYSGMVSQRSFSAAALLEYGACLPNDVWALPWDRKPLSASFRLIWDHFLFACAHPQLAFRCGGQILRLIIKLCRRLLQRK